MRRTTHTPEEIIAKLRRVETMVAHGVPTSVCIAAMALSKSTFHRWRRQYADAGNGHSQAAAKNAK